MRKDFLFVLSLLGITVACRDEDRSPTSPDTSPTLASATAALMFAQVSAGTNHSCGVTSDNRLYCWGQNTDGQLGDGTTTERLVPVPVAGSLRFRQVSAGWFMTCAVTTGDRAYCWGANGVGQLGDGTTKPRLSPAAVTGGRLFRQVDAANGQACAVTSSGNRAFCWGSNSRGQLGIGNNTGPQTGSFGSYSSKPVAVACGLAFRHVTVGDEHSCGVTTDNRVFCWGFNRYGQVGDNTSGWLKVKPSQVAGTRRYQQVDAGHNFTCAVTTGSRVFCWGFGLDGELGNGAAKSSRSPQAVSGGLSVDRVSAGGFHACAESTDNRAWCWGANGPGSLGDGTFTSPRLAPVAVVGGLTFSQLSAGGHSCGKTAAGKAYCWGGNFDGELGNGTTDASPTPVPVAGAM